MLRTIIFTAALYAMYFNNLNAQDPYTQKIDSLEKVIRSLEKVEKLEKQIDHLHQRDLELYIARDFESEIRRATGGLVAGVAMTLLGGGMLIESASSSDEISEVFFGLNGALFAIPGIILTGSKGSKLSKLKKLQKTELGINSSKSGIGLALTF